MPRRRGGSFWCCQSCHSCRSVCALTTSTDDSRLPRMAAASAVASAVTMSLNSSMRSRPFVDTSQQALSCSPRCRFRHHADDFCNPVEVDARHPALEGDEPPEDQRSKRIQHKIVVGGDREFTTPGGPVEHCLSALAAGFAHIIH